MVNGTVYYTGTWQECLLRWDEVVRLGYPANLKKLGMRVVYNPHSLKDLAARVVRQRIHDRQFSIARDITVVNMRIAREMARRETLKGRLPAEVKERLGWSSVIGTCTRSYVSDY